MQPFIVCYHRVVEDFERSSRMAIPSMLVSVKTLDRHIDWLSRRFSILSLDEIGDRLESGRPFGRPAAAITFDDGYADVYHNGFPLLQRKGVPAAVFVVTGLVGTGKPQVFDRLYLLLKQMEMRGVPLAPAVDAGMRRLGLETMQLPPASGIEDGAFRIMTFLLESSSRETVELLMKTVQDSRPFDETALDEFAPLTWDMIRTMHRNGITIGSHTESHALLTSESLATAERQLADSKAALESRLNSPIRHFAYPDGRFNAPVVQAVNSTGYRFAYSICRRRDGSHPLLTIPRKVLWERACTNAWGTFSGAIMNCHAHGAFDSRTWCEHDHSINRTGETNGTIN